MIQIINLLGNNLIFLSKISQITIVNCTFSKNIVREQIVSSEFLMKENINDTVCEMTNVITNQLSYLGGCFRSFNTQSRTYSNVSIESGFSDYTTIGIKIIDEDDFLANEVSVIFVYKYST